MGVYRARLGEAREPIYLPVRVSATPDRVETLQQSGRSFCPGLFVRLVLDTGSRGSTLAPAVLQQLQCADAGTVRIQTALGQEARILFEVRMDFLAGTLAPLPKILVASLPVPAKLRAHFHGVLGRDVLRQWDFRSNGLGNRLTIRDRPSFWSWLCS